jgi:RHS repeat-associated protein
VTVTDESTVTTYTGNDMSQYTQVGSTTYSYDASGNMTSKTDGSGVTTYTYDAEDQLMRVETPGHGTWTYTYDALGNRASVEHDDVVTRYLNDPTGFVDVVGQYDGGGQLVARYVHGLGLAARLNHDNQRLFYSFDAIGNVRQVTDSIGAVVNSYDYTPFGSLLQANETSPDPFRYVGRYGIMQEEHGLSFMRARYYSPELGIFTSLDPRLDASTSSYVYADNRPTISVDVTGAETVWTYGVIPEWAEEEHSETDEFRIYVWDKGRVSSHITGEGVRTNRYQKEYYKLQRQKGGWLIVKKAVVTDTQVIYPDPPEDPPEDPEDEENPENKRSDDPNEKAGPKGYGGQGSVHADTEFLYTIYFENKAEAGAPAQEVFITDDLDPSLDWSTFRLVEVAWGDTIVTAPAGTANWFHRETVSDYRPEIAKSWWVDVEVHVDRVTGRLSVAFHTLDPQTEDLPYDVFAGFLPPNDETGRGDGHVSFTIRPLPDLEIGTQIGNRASIVFDTNEPIITNDWWNTIGFRSYLPIVAR